MIGKNKGFQKLEDETKKTVRRTKLYHIGIIVNIMIIIAVIVFFIMYVNKNNSNDENNNTVSNEFVNKIEYTEFKVVGDANKCYVIGNKNGKWYEIAESNDSISIIGSYLNKLYCYNSNGICYIDFEKDDKKIEEWLKYKEYKLSESYETGILSLQKAFIVDDTIYYKYNLDIAADTKASGILSIDVDSSSFEDSNQVITRVKDTGWDMDVDRKIIYYLNDNNEIRKYSIETESDELIISNIRNFEIKNEKILYLIINNDYRETEGSIVQAATYELRLYDLNTTDDKLIFESSLYNVTSGTLNGFAQLYNEDVYYKNDNNIVKYNNGTNEIVFTQEEGTLKTFKYRDDGVLKIFVDDDTPKYIYNGKITARVPSVYSVTMKDGTTAEL